MCLAVPGRITKIHDDMAIVDFGGVRKDISIALVDAKEDDYVLVHAGFAIRVLSIEDAKKNLELLERLGSLMSGAEDARSDD